MEKFKIHQAVFKQKKWNKIKKSNFTKKIALKNECDFFWNSSYQFNYWTVKSTSNGSACTPSISCETTFILYDPAAVGVNAVALS